MATDTHYYPIRNVAEITGVNPVTLRAWERRYGLLQPHRTDSGHRLYSDEDIRLIQHVTTLLNDGLSISQVVRNLKQPAPESGERSLVDSDIWADYQSHMLSAIARFDELELDSTYQEILGLYPVDTVNTLLIRPLLEHLGNCWKSTHAGIAQEHFFTAYLRKKLIARLHHSSIHNQGPRLILCSPSGEQHELGMLLFAITAVSHGYQLVMLGPDMPLREVALVTEATNASGVVLSMSTRPPRSVREKDLPELIQAVSIPVFIGGRYAQSAEADLAGMGAVPVGNDALPALRIIRAGLQATV